MTTRTTKKSAERSGPPKSGKLSTFTLMMLTVAAIASLRGLPSNAEQGMQLIFFLCVSALVFFLPSSLVSAELATGWQGGVFNWVKEAFGDRWGFVAIWLQWIQNVVWYPTVLSFAGGAIAYIINPNLAESGVYTAVVILAIYWLSTFISLRGVTVASKFGSWGLMIGTLVPGLLIIALGVVYLVQGNTPGIALNPGDIVPRNFDLSVLVFTVGMFLAYAGVEMNANHAQDVDNPNRSFPLAILGAGIITVVLFVLGSLAVAVVVPVSELSLTAGIMEAYQAFFANFNIGWATPLVGVLLVIGVFGGVITWISGPSRGLLEVGKAGYLPVWLQHTNQHGVQNNILVSQGVIVTLLALIFVFVPNVSSGYWLITSMTVQIYLLMYVLLFLTALRLRQTQPEVKRAYRVPAMGLVAGVGLVASVAAILLGFVPPNTWTASPVLYDLILVVGIVVFSAGPFIFYALRKPSWRTQAPNPPSDTSPNAKSGKTKAAA